MQEVSTAGPGLFKRGFHKLTEEWIAIPRETDTGKRGFVMYKDQQFWVDLNQFADDAENTVVVDTPTEVLEHERTSTEEWRRLGEPWNMKQNEDKKESITRFVGKGALAKMTRTYQPHPPQLQVVEGKLKSEAR